MIHSRRVLHEAPDLQGNRFVWCRLIPLASIPPAFDHGTVAVLAMLMWPAHYARWKLHLNDVEPRLHRVAFNDRGFEAETIRLVHPFELIRWNAKHGLCRLLAENCRREKDQD